MRAAAILLLGLAAAACKTDSHAMPVPGHDARTFLGTKGTAQARWPAPWSRGARFLVENRTGAPVETILLDLGGDGLTRDTAPRELVEVEIEQPAGAAAVILAAPVGSWPLRARLGTPGTVLLEPGATLSLRLRVEGNPGRATAKFEVPK